MHWMCAGCGVVLLFLLVQSAPAQVIEDGGLTDLPAPPTEVEADAELNTEVDSDLGTGVAEDAPAPTSGAIIDAEPSIERKSSTDATIEADAKPRLNATSERRSTSADTDSKHRGKLGVYVAERGNRVTIHNLMSGGAAANAGLEAGDEILSVNGRRITSSAQLRRALREAADEGGTATIIADRDGDIHTIEADVSGRFVAESAGDRVQTYYRGPDDEAHTHTHADAHVHVPAYPTYWYSWPYYSTYYYGGYPTYPYYYGAYYHYGYYAPVGYYYPYCW